MKQLYVMRHGIAVPSGTPGIEDDERPLTREGEKKVKEIGQGLKALGLDLDRIISSPLPRALKTAEILADVLQARKLLETDDILRPGRSAESIREWITGHAANHLMIVGHNPTLSDLVALLVTGRTSASISDLRKGGIAAFETASDGSLQLEWLARPKLLRAREE